MDDLETRLHQAMVSIYQTAKQELGYNATYFWQMVLDYGGLEAARRLLATENPSSGFGTLWEHGRLDLSVEAHVIQPEFESLFTPEEIATATARLREYEFEFD